MRLRDGRIVAAGWFVLVLGLLGIAACGGGGEKSAGQGKIEDTGQAITGDPGAAVANVEGEPITLAEVDLLSNYYASAGAGQDQAVQGRRALQLQAIEHLIDQALLVREAKQRGIAVPDSAVEQVLVRWEGQFESPQERDSMLAAKGMTREAVRDRFHRDMLVQNLVQQAVSDTIQVSDAEIQNYYDTHPEYFETTEVHARHILKKVAQDAPAESLAAARATMEQILARIRAGEDFAQLARQNSDCPSAPQGGDLGFFGHGRMTPRFEQAAFAVAPGGVSDIVQTEFGYHIIKVEERRNEGMRPLAEVSGAIRQFLFNQHLQSAVDGLAKRLRAGARIDRKVAA